MLLLLLLLLLAVLLQPRIADNNGLRTKQSQPVHMSYHAVRLTIVVS